METVTDFIFLGSKITTDGDCSHKIKRHLLLGRKAMTNLSSVQSLIRVHLYAITWTATCEASLSITISRSLLKLMAIQSVMTSNHLILCRPLLLPSIFPSIRVFPVSGFSASGGQNIVTSASASVLPMTIQGCFPLGLTGLISLLSKGLPRVFSRPQFKKISSLVLSLLYGPTLISTHDCWKNHSFDWQSDVSAF